MHPVRQTGKNRSSLYHNVTLYNHRADKSRETIWDV